MGHSAHKRATTFLVLGLGHMEGCDRLPALQSLRSVQLRFASPIPFFALLPHSAHSLFSKSMLHMHMAFYVSLHSPCAA